MIKLKCLLILFSMNVLFVHSHTKDNMMQLFGNVSISFIRLVYSTENIEIKAYKKYFLISLHIKNISTKTINKIIISLRNMYFNIYVDSKICVLLQKILLN